MIASTGFIAATSSVRVMCDDVRLADKSVSFAEHFGNARARSWRNVCVVMFLS